MSHSDHGDSSSPVTPKDFVAFVRGQASADQTSRVQVALNDPASELNGWLKGVETWAKEAFPPAAQSTSIPESHPMVRLNAILDFVQRHRADGHLTEPEVKQIISAGALNEADGFPASPLQAVTATARMTKAIVDLHPELASELAGLEVGRGR